VYFRVGMSGNYEHNPVWKLSANAEKKTEYTLPSDLEKSLNVAAFAALASDFYELTYDVEGTYIVAFKGDGDFRSKFRLAVPEAFRPDELALFSSGQFLVSGQIRKAESAPSAQYAAVFDGGGKLVKELGNSRGNTGDALQVSAVAVGGSDGNVYDLVGDQVNVISGSGTLVRSFHVKGPEAYTPRNIHVSDGIVSVQYGKTGEDKRLSYVFKTYESHTGAEVAQYVPTPELGNAPLCFSANDGYTFYRNKGGKVQFVRGWVK